MDPVVLAIFVLVYVGMILGEIPGLALDRTAMLLLPYAKGPEAGAVLALSSTLAGNLFIVASIANIIVVDQARRLGVEIGWRRHARVGVPVTVTTLALAWAWLWLRH